MILVIKDNAETEVHFWYISACLLSAVDFRLALLTLIVWLALCGNPQHKLKKTSISTCVTAEKGAGNIRKKGHFYAIFLSLRFGIELQIGFKHLNVLSKHESLL